MWKDLVVILVAYDVWFYVAHRWMHSSQYLMPFHKHHHQYDHDKKMTYWDAGRGHIVENILTNIGFFVPIVLLSSDFITGSIAYSFITLRGLLRHDHRAPDWIGKHHLIHHSHPNYNFSSYPIDLLFGTVKK